MSFLWNPPEKVVPTEERIKKMTFDIFFILTISTSMYVAWYAYRAPSGVSHIWHTLAAAAGGWMTVFFIYFMVAESPHRPMYHTALVALFYCTMAATYTTLQERGKTEVRMKLRDNKSR